MKEIKLTQDKVALVDDENFEELNKHKWCAVKFGLIYYAVRKTSKKESVKEQNVWMHRVINKTPSSMVTDHVDGNGLNNQKYNLRSCTTRENSRNRSSNKNNKSGFKGVSLHKETNKWRARISIGDKNISLGLFDSPKLAHYAYTSACYKYHGEFAKTV
jgi:hypothetical protein